MSQMIDLEFEPNGSSQGNLVGSLSHSILNFYIEALHSLDHIISLVLNLMVGSTPIKVNVDDISLVGMEFIFGLPSCGPHNGVLDIQILLSGRHQLYF